MVRAFSFLISRQTPKRKNSRRNMCAVHDLAEFLGLIGKLRSKIGPFLRVFGKIVKFYQRVGVTGGFQADRFPVTLPYGLPSALLMKFPIQIIVFFLGRFTL